MSTVTWLADVLRAAGVRVVEEGNWRGRMVSGSFDPMGVLWHHTAFTSSPSNPAPALGTCIDGRSDLQGPLCQALVDYNGVFHLIAAGRANHAGLSGGSGPVPAGDGNTLLIGWEIDYNGTSQSMSDAQYSSCVRATAAVLGKLGRDASYARGHRETSTTGKIDPSFIDLNAMRADVAQEMAGSGKTLAARGVDVTSWGPRRLDVFARATNNTLVHKWYDGTAWSSWEGLGGTLTSDPTAVSWASGRLDVFARGGGNQLIHRFFQAGTGWSGWEHLGGNLSSGPDAASWGARRLDVFARGTSDVLTHRWYDGSSWSAWESLGGTLTSDPTAVSWGPGRIDVFARGGDDQLVQRYFANAAWAARWTHHGGTLTSSPEVSSWGPSRLDVFARGGDSQLVHRYFSGNVWSGWGHLGGTMTSAPSAASWGPGRIDVLARGGDNELVHRWFTSDPGWSGTWAHLGTIP